VKKIEEAESKDIVNVVEQPEIKDVDNKESKNM